MLQVTYTTLIDGYVRDCDVQAAKDLMTDMIAVGVKPNVVTYNTLLRGYAEDDAVKMEVWLALMSGHHCLGQLCQKSLGVSYPLGISCSGSRA